MKKLIVALFAIVLISPAYAGFRLHGSAPAVVAANGAEVSLLNISQGTEYPFLNLMKQSVGWAYSDNQGIPEPNELDANGYPKFNSAGIISHGGLISPIDSATSQAMRPGDYVLAWTGGRRYVVQNSYLQGGGTVATVSCTGTSAGSFAQSCDNTACSSLTGQIVGTTLTVTVAPTGSGCTIAYGVPISSSVILISTFGTPTIIAGSSAVNSGLCSPSCTGAGGVGTYAVNQSQNVASGTIFLGGRLRISVTSDNAVTTTNWGITARAVNNDGQTSNLAFYHVNDEANWLASATPCGSGRACIVGQMFKSRIKQAGFSVMRDLDWQQSNVANCALWSSRKPIQYYQYPTFEFRDAPGGTETYTNLSGTTTIAKVGQYVNASGTGASGGTISTVPTTTATFTASINNGSGSAGNLMTVTGTPSGTINIFNTISGSGVTADTIVTGNATTNSGYCTPNCTGTGGAGTYAVAYVSGAPNNFRTGTQLVASESMSSVHNNFAITLGSGAQVDKQSIQIKWPATGDYTSTIALNGNAPKLILASNGVPLPSAFGAAIPSLNIYAYVVYDATLGGWLNNGGFANAQVMQVNNVHGGLQCGAPADVFIEINAELGTTPWDVTPILSLDPTTDWVTQFATYTKTYYPSVKPIFETTDEPWNLNGICIYLGLKSAVYIAQDSAWQADGNDVCGQGNVWGEIGKVLSTAGQDLNATLGAGNYELLSPTWSGVVADPQSLTSPGYVNQTLIQVQTGYNQNASYKFTTRVSINNYLNPSYYGANTPSVQGIEVGIAYCYFNYSISSACAYPSQTAAVNAYVASTAISGGSQFDLYDYTNRILPTFEAFGKTCGSGTRPSGCTVNATTPIMFYEGGWAMVGQPSDVSQNVTAGSNQSNAILSIANNGCVAGQSVSATFSGGTWPGSGNYVVQASGTDANHCAINLNSTSLGALSSGNLTYTGSQNYVNYLRNASYTAPVLTTYMTQLFNTIASMGGVNPSQFQMASPSLWTNNSNNSISGYDPWYALSFDLYGYYQLGLCSSCTSAGSTLTLGGTIGGMFSTGQQLLGSGIPTPTILGACTRNGAGPCGFNAGDTFALSQPVTVSSGEPMGGNIIPATVGTLTTSPVTAWKAFCNWTGNGASC